MSRAGGVVSHKSGSANNEPEISRPPKRAATHVRYFSEITPILPVIIIVPGLIGCIQIGLVMVACTMSA